MNHDLLRTKEDLILCGYQNPSPQVQVVKIFHLSSYHLEKVIFPQEYWLFYAPAEARLEIYTSSPPRAMLADKISCHQLQVGEIF